MGISSNENHIFSYYYLTVLYLLTCLGRSIASDVFCGNLTVYQRRWMLEKTMVLASRATTDLKQCLHICCSLTNCDGVTFVGVVEKKTAQENCLLIKCYDGCEFSTDSDELFEGVSVRITPSRKYSYICLIIVISVFCIGFNIILISAYICWRRKKIQKRKAHISTITTLHAFNPV
ncbi:unnamed protein product [Thelazia callipaeda]|uniref:Apple domain-containing protein n=1 Tax=Thelazia callipaeda TaxID=103827 RepID=A0A0N5CWD3_THECL|nr:unnamed protein product [Thelazia callipaeda]